MRLPDLIAVTARVLGTDPTSVREVARRLREAGLIQTGPKGRGGGARMTAADAAALTVGMLSEAGPAHAAATTRLLLDMDVDHMRRDLAKDRAWMWGISGDDLTLGLAVKTLFEHDLLEWGQVPTIQLRVLRPYPRAELIICVDGERVGFVPFAPNLPNDLDGSSSGLRAYFGPAFSGWITQGDMKVATSISHRTFMEIGPMLRAGGSA